MTTAREKWREEELAKFLYDDAYLIVNMSLGKLDRLIRDAMAFADTTKVCDLCATRYKNTRRTP